MGQRLKVLQSPVTNRHTALFHFFPGFLSGSGPVFSTTGWRRLCVELECNNCTSISHGRIKNVKKTTCSRPVLGFRGDDCAAGLGFFGGLSKELLELSDPLPRHHTFAAVSLSQCWMKHLSASGSGDQHVRALLHITVTTPVVPIAGGKVESRRGWLVYLPR